MVLGNKQKEALRISIKMWEWLSSEPGRSKCFLPLPIQVECLSFTRENSMEESTCALCNYFRCKWKGVFRRKCPLYIKGYCQNIYSYEVIFWVWLREADGITKQHCAKQIYNCLVEYAKQHGVV